VILHDYEDKLDTAEEVDYFSIEERRRNRIHYMAKLYLRYESNYDDESAGDHLSEITEVHRGDLKSLYIEDIFPPSEDEEVTDNGNEAGHAENVQNFAQEPEEDDDPAEDVQSFEQEATVTKEDNQAKEDDNAEETQGELIGLVADMATTRDERTLEDVHHPDKHEAADELAIATAITQDETMLEDVHHPDKHGAADELATAMETATKTESEAAEEATHLEGHETKGDELDACTPPTEDTEAAEEGTQLEGQEKNTDELAACTPPTEDTNAAVEVPLMSEVTKAKVVDDDGQSTCSRLAKMDNSRSQAVVSQVQQAVKVNSELGKDYKDPLEKDDIARVEDGKSLKKALVMVEEVVRKRNVNTGICYCRYKVCSKYGHVEKTFARNQLLYDEHLTASVQGNDVNTEGFLSKMSIAEVIAHQVKLTSIIICRCKKRDCATSANCIRRKNGKLCTLKCLGGKGVKTLSTLCKTEE